MANIYTPDFIANALAQHELNGGNVKYTAKQLEIPRKTLEFLVKKAGVATLAIETKDYGALWAAKEHLALERLGELIPTASFRDLSIFAGIAADKHMDYSMGRKGADKEDPGDGNTIFNVQVNYYGGALNGETPLQPLSE
mgnify:CR=1 FL=1